MAPLPPEKPVLIGLTRIQSRDTLFNHAVTMADFAARHSSSGTAVREAQAALERAENWEFWHEWANGAPSRFRFWITCSANPDAGPPKNVQQLKARAHLPRTIYAEKSDEEIEEFVKSLRDDGLCVDFGAEWQVSGPPVDFGKYTRKDLDQCRKEEESEKFKAFPES